MFTEISEQAFLSMASAPIQYIGIYELNWIMDDNLLDCDGVIVAFEDRKILVSSKIIVDEDCDFVYYDFTEEYECRKILSSAEEPIRFIRKEENGSPVLRFQIGIRHILVVAYYEKWVDVALSHWDVNDNFVEFDNDTLLNDRL